MELTVMNSVTVSEEGVFGTGSCLTWLLLAFDGCSVLCFYD